jgi:hypothetical protein
MAKLIIIPNEGVPTPEEREHNRALIERYMPAFPTFFLEARKELGASIMGIRIDIPDSDLNFVQSNMDSTKRLL